MAEKQGRGKGKKARKHGHNKRKPSHQRYTQSRRWEKNKLRKARKYANKFGIVVRIKVEGEWVAVRPAT